MSRGDVRRALIADSAIAVLAAGGARALTHKAVDAGAGLPAGSASYHFRTRKALITAAVERIRVLSREAFDAAARGAGVAAAVPPASTSAATPPASAADEAAALAADQLLRLAGERREQALAVFALLPEAAEDCELRSALLRCLFSRELAEDLMARLGSEAPEADAARFVDLLTGMLVRLLFAPAAECPAPSPAGERPAGPGTEGTVESEVKAETKTKAGAEAVEEKVGAKAREEVEAVEARARAEEAEAEGSVSTGRVSGPDARAHAWVPPEARAEIESALARFLAAFPS
jgi:DNA-binding transcriptional regulator YbjK